MSGKDLPWTDGDTLPDSLLQAAAVTLDAELEWLAASLQARLAAYFGQPPSSPALPDAPPLDQPGCPYAAALRRRALDATERLLVALALAPSLRPNRMEAKPKQHNLQYFHKILRKPIDNFVRREKH